MRIVAEKLPSQPSPVFTMNVTTYIKKICILKKKSGRRGNALWFLDEFFQGRKIPQKRITARRKSAPYIDNGLLDINVKWINQHAIFMIRV